MGTAIETLADLLRPGLAAVCVGINPSPVSVAAGHYYQGRAGQRYFARLRDVGLLRDTPDAFEDDAAFAAGIGFTDIVKRPTPTADDLLPVEFDHGRDLLAAKLDAAGTKLVIFTFKKTAQVLFGDFLGNGFVNGLSIGDAEVFVMPGPYEAAGSAHATLATLAAALSATD